MEAVSLQQLTLPVVVTAALVDSINPCAFAVLLTFIAATLVLAERASAGGARWFLWRMGLVYVAGVFLTYLGLGLGLLGFASAFGQTHWVSRVAALAAIGLGLLALQEALVPEWGIRLGVPQGMHDWLHRLTGKATLPAVFSAGVLVGLCTVPCSGAIYLGVLGLLAAQTTYPEGLAYLVLYNAIFVLPLLAMLAVASSRLVFNGLGRWQLHHRSSLKLGLGFGAIALGFLLLLTV
jgi:cytochrome c biogenesis protein CcdA